MAIVVAGELSSQHLLIGKMRSFPGLIFVGILIQVSIPKAACTANDDPWLRSTRDALDKLKNVAELDTFYYTSFLCHRAPEKINCFMEKGPRYLPFFKNFLINSNLDQPLQTDQRLFLFSPSFDAFTDGGTPVAQDEVESNFISSPSLKAKYDSTVKPLMTALKRGVDSYAGRNPLGSRGYVLPLQTACSTLPARDVPTLSVKDVCQTPSVCSDSVHGSTDNACGQNGECDINRAIPLMIGVFFYKVSFAFVDKFCRKEVLAATWTKNLQALLNRWT